MTTRADVVTTGYCWLKTRFHHQASLRGIGTDCIGLIVGVARELGMPEAEAFAADPIIKGYGREPDPEMLEAACDRYLDRCANPVPGDILLMKFKSDPQHFALISKPKHMIHAYAQARMVVENGIDYVWSQRIVRAYSYRGIV